ncbi:MAG: NUDIX hydrolase [Candidatus Woesearchaeota archaeon]|nr:NUDIX hydrolase [Candidatus Woesearchaeota archaeon]
MNWDMCYIAAMNPSGETRFADFLKRLDVTGLHIWPVEFLPDATASMIPKIACSPTTSPIAAKTNEFNPYALTRKIQQYFGSDGLITAIIDGDDATNAVRSLRDGLGYNTLDGQRIHVSVGGFYGPEADIMYAGKILKGERLIGYITGNFALIDENIIRINTLPIIGVGAVILDSRDRILLMERTEKRYNGWFIPTGNIQDNPEQTVISEMYEELGVKASIKRTLKTCLNQTGEYEQTIFQVDIGNQVPHNREIEKCRGLRYFSSDEIMRLDSPFAKEIYLMHRAAMR